MKLKVEDLEQIFKLLIAKLKNDGYDTLDIDYDNYWLISTDEWNNFKNEVNPTVGSLKDDLENLLLVKEGKQIFTYLDFERVASLLRAISEKIVPTNIHDSQSDATK